MERVYYKVNDIIVGRVTGIQPYGAFVVFENGQTGLIHISEISSKFVKSIEDYVKVDDEVKVKVLGYEEKNNYLKLSIKALGERERQNLKKPFSFNKPKRIKMIFTDKDFYPLKEKLNSWIDESMEEQNMISLDFSHIIEHVDLDSYKDKVKEINNMINNYTVPRKGMFFKNNTTPYLK